MLKLKYPRTFHVPWTQTTTSDDKILKNVDHFKGRNIVITEKMDGENTTIAKRYTHARSIDSKDHPSRHWIKVFHSVIESSIPEWMRICGENVFAKHSIYYSELPSYFFGFSIWDGETCLSYNDTVEEFDKLGICYVPILYIGSFDDCNFEEIYSKNGFYGEMEGYVIRLSDSFSYNNFSKSVAKFVRKDHVTTSKHWMTEKIVKNKLAGVIK